MNVMEVLMTLLLLTGLAILVVGFGADSRPTDAERPTRWFPGRPRD
ncbi:MAG TPA: hypothetical protein VN906_05165 [Candidatus Sulfotelmatobacter sp.]|jgi:hypothetical protein|nr:hypothetical protein [Candidatus Sulfotelmatobacter sp.]